MMLKRTVIFLLLLILLIPGSLINAEIQEKEGAESNLLGATNSLIQRINLHTERLLTG